MSRLFPRKNGIVYFLPNLENAGVNVDDDFEKLVTSYADLIMDTEITSISFQRDGVQVELVRVFGRKEFMCDTVILVKLNG